MGHLKVGVKFLHVSEVDNITASERIYIFAKFAVFYLGSSD